MIKVSRELVRYQSTLAHFRRYSLLIPGKVEAQPDIVSSYASTVL
jgi:hypothetical protein